ncbi:MAG: 2-hydroxycarboxylate transporter family protein [Brevinema sp.]
MEKSFKLFGMSPILFFGFFTVVLLAHFTGRIPNNVLGALALCFSLGIFFGEIGDRIPIWKDWIGGGAIFAFFGASILEYLGFFSERELILMDNFMNNTDFLNLYIATLITGSVLSLERNVLIKSFLGYIPAILGGLLGASLLGILGGMIFGITPIEIIIQYVLPIMGGGNGGGAVPLSEIYEATTGIPRDVYYSKAIAILTMGNIFAIIGSALLKKIGNLYPNLTGYGVLMKNQKDLDSQQEKVFFTAQDIAISIFLVAVIYTFAGTITKYIGTFGTVKIHQLAYMVLTVILLNVFGVVPTPVRVALQKVQGFFTKQFLWVLMIGVGIVFTDLPSLMATINLTNVVLCMFIITGTIIGSGLTGMLVKFYFVETAITAGLCMANRGGSGDIECLTAADRMSLMPYAQISSRIGGGIVLVIASLVFGLFVQ